MRFSKSVALCAAIGGLGMSLSANGSLIHRYSFDDGTVNDSVGGANGTLFGSLNGGPTVAGGSLQLNNPGFHGPSSGSNYLSMPVGILPTSGSATIEQWFTIGGSGYFTEAYTFSNNNNDTNGPGATNGQYLMATISAPQNNGGNGNNTGGSHIAQSLAGYSGGETDAFESTPGIGAGGGGYLDDGETFMLATVIDGTAGTLSYYLYDISLGGVGGLQSSIPAIPLSSYAFTNAYLGRSAFGGDNVTNGSIDEFRIYNNAQSPSQIAADFAAGADAVIPVPEPASLGLMAVAGLGLLKRRSRCAE